MNHEEFLNQPISLQGYARKYDKKNKDFIRK